MGVGGGGGETETERDRDRDRDSQREGETETETHRDRKQHFRMGGRSFEPAAGHNVVGAWVVHSPVDTPSPVRSH